MVREVQNLGLRRRAAGRRRLRRRVRSAPQGWSVLREQPRRGTARRVARRGRRVIATYGSLFSGIGGLDLGVERATGARCLWQCEPDPYCAAVLAQHWPGVPNLGRVELVNDAEKVDLICGGFPCQDISQAGKRAGITGARSELWGEFARIVREFRPRYVFVENVADLVVRGLDVVLGDLAACGYDAEWSSLRAADVGAPHKSRRRIFILAHALHDGCKGRGALDYDDRDHARRNDADRRGAGFLWPPPPDAPDESWISWCGIGGRGPGVRRGTYGAPSGLDARRRRRRIRHLGNTVIPAQAATALAALLSRIEEGS